MASRASPPSHTLLCRVVLRPRRSPPRDRPRYGGRRAARHGRGRRAHRGERRHRPEGLRRARRRAGLEVRRPRLRDQPPRPAGEVHRVPVRRVRRPGRHERRPASTVTLELTTCLEIAGRESGAADPRGSRLTVQMIPTRDDELEFEEFDPPRPPCDHEEQEAIDGEHGRHPPCGHRSPSAGNGPWICTRKERHTGRHIAGVIDGDGIVARWERPGAHGRATHRDDTCPKCGEHGVWVNLALVCPRGCGVFG